MFFAKSEFSKFKYNLYDVSGRQIGTLRLPAYLAVPKRGWVENALPTKLQDCVILQISGRTYEVEYELLSDRFLIGNDLKFTLITEGKPIASASVFVRRKLWEVSTINAEYGLTKKGKIFSYKFEITKGPSVIGRIMETTGFSLWRRTFQIDLPDEIDEGVQVFFFFLTVNATFR